MLGTYVLSAGYYDALSESTEGSLSDPGTLQKCFSTWTPW